MNSRPWKLHRSLAASLAVALGAAILPSPAAASPLFTFQKVALEAEPAPDTEPGTLFGPLNDVNVTSVPSLDADGTISFVATLTGPLVTTTNHTGIWAWDAGVLTRVARAGPAAPETAPGGLFGSFPLDFALTPPTLGGGRLAFTATVSGPGIGADNDEGSWALEVSTLRLVAREGAPAPGLPAGVFLGPPSPPELDPDAAGRRVRGLLDEARPAGPGVAAWDARNDAGARVAPGVDHARLVAGAASRTVSLVVLPAR